MSKRDPESDPSASATGPAGEAAQSAARLRILVVEDDPQALSATTDALQALGHFAAGASSAEVARSRFLDGAFDVLITDIGLPGLSGDELVQAIRRGALAPLEVIYATGRAQPPGNTSIWLQKPYQLEDLEAALETARQSLRAPCARDGRVAHSEGS